MLGRLEVADGPTVRRCLDRLPRNRVKTCEPAKVWWTMKLTAAWSSDQGIAGEYVKSPV